MATGPSGAQQSEFVARRLVAATDFFVWAAILALGVFQVYFHLRSPDFPFEDVAYSELAKSLLHNGFYGFNAVPERVQPPGLPILLAAICKGFGCGYGVVLGSMTVFLTIGFLVWYLIIRREEGRGVAAATCLLLSSSISVFSLVTRQICPSIPYFCTSALALWTALKLEAAQARAQKYLLSIVLALLVALSVLIQTAAIALVGAMLASIAFSFLKDRRIAGHRLRVFLPAILLGILTQVVWMHRGSSPALEWPSLPGYPGSYLSQLKLKVGNYPELGPANTLDLLYRVKANVLERTSTVSHMLTEHWVNSSYSSLLVSISLLLTVLGIAGSLWKSGNILAWYFLGYEFIYVMWPWQMEFRFLLPSTPLACLFMYRGARNVALWAQRNPRQTAIGSLVVSLPLGALASRHAWGKPLSSGLQWSTSAAVWFTVAVLAVWVIRKDRLPEWLAKFPDRAIFRKRLTVGPLSFNSLQFGATALVVLLVVRAVSRDLLLARDSLNFGEAGLESSADIVAARWIRSHTDPDAVIAARHVPLVYHYAQRKVIWFAPIVRPQVMLEGLHRLSVRYVIVADRDDSYYLPRDEVCFDIVERAYPDAFRLAAQLGRARIYEVSPALAAGKF